MAFFPVFPEGRSKALVLSFDDGASVDRRLVEILNAANLKGTFHLCSGFVELDSPNYIPSRELNSLYSGHEIAAHSVHHFMLDILAESEILREFFDDRRALEAIFSRPVTGFSYPSGTAFARMVECARSTGFEYARTTQNTNRFAWPEDLLRWHPSCHHTQALELLPQFLTGYGDSRIFMVWGHSHEFENQNNWGLIENFSRQVSRHSEIWSVTALELARYITASRRLVVSANGHWVYNPSAVTVWLQSQKDIVPLGAGKSCEI